MSHLFNSCYFHWYFCVWTCFYLPQCHNTRWSQWKQLFNFTWFGLAFFSFYLALNISNLSVLVTIPKEIRHHPNNLLECFVYHYFLEDFRLFEIFYSCKGLYFVTKLSRVLGVSNCLENFPFLFDRARKQQGRDFFESFKYFFKLKLDIFILMKSFLTMSILC